MQSSEERCAVDFGWPFCLASYHEPVSARCNFTVTFLYARLNLVLLQESCSITKPYPARDSLGFSVTLRELMNNGPNCQ